MFIKDEQWYYDFEHSRLKRIIHDPEEEQAYASMVNKGDFNYAGNYQYPYATRWYNKRRSY